MHEAGLTHDLLAEAPARLAACPSSRVARLVLAVGEGSGVDPDSIAFYFQALSHGTAAAYARLEFLSFGAGRRCRACHVWHPYTDGGFWCTACGRDGLGTGERPRGVSRRAGAGRRLTACASQFPASS